MLRRGEIVLIPIPFTDLTSSKKRPVLILSSDSYNESTEDIIVAAITSNLDNVTHAVKITNDDLADGKLLLDSCVRADKLYTLSQTIAIKKFGTVKDSILEAVTENILNILDSEHISERGSCYEKC